MDIRIVRDTISFQEVKDLAQEFYKTMIKGTVDIERKIIALCGEYHVDSNMALVEAGSLQANVWGFNIHPNEGADNWIEYVSLINIRPLAGNKSMEVKDETLRRKMAEIINSKIVR